MSAHLSLDELAELDEGLLPPERISAIRAHLHDCDDCRARADAITTTRSMLGDLPALAMPDEVKARIDSALAAESPLTRDTDAGATAGPTPIDLDAPSSPVDLDAPSSPVDLDAPSSPVDLDARSSDVVPDVVALPRRRFGRPSAAACAAAAAIVLAVGAIIIGHINHKSGGTAVNASGDKTPGTSSTANPLNLDLHNTVFVKKATGSRYNASDLTTLAPKLLGSTHPSAQAPAATTNGAFGAASPGASSAPGNAPGESKSNVTKTDGSPLADTQADTGRVPAALLPIYHSPAKLQSCAQTWGGSGVTPAVVDFGRWTDKTGKTSPAIILVFKTNTLDTAAVWVVKANCGSLLDYQIVSVP